MSSRTLPPRPNLDQLKLQAKELHRAHRDGDRSAAARIAAHHPEMKGLSPQAVLEKPFALAEAQLVIAREYGVDSWAKLKHRVELGDQVGQFTPHPRFEEAVAALDEGDLDRLRGLLASDPALVHARTNLEPPYHYFTGATLLHHVAGNPDRGRLDGTRPPLPQNSADLARALLAAGADVHASTLGPNGGDTMGLLTTSKQASDADVTGPLIDVLLEYGATLDLTSDDCLDASLANHAPRAAEKMIALGAKADLLAAAALGRLDLLRDLFDRDGRLLSRPKRDGKEMPDRDAIGLAALYAYVREQRAAIDFLLEKDGNWNMIGVNNGALLHRAAFAGDLDMVQRLVAKGADLSDRHNPFHSTPLAWADHNHQTAVFEWLRDHCAIDLHDAVTFDFADHVRARLNETPASVNARLDHWDIPQSTPLHWAAAMNRGALATLLLEHGADANILSGNGLTPLDVADYQGATAAAAVLEGHGGTRTAEAAKSSGQPSLRPFERIANDIVLAYRSGDGEALKRIREFFKQTVSVPDIRKGVQRRLQKGEDADISVAEARDVVAGLRGFASWAALAESVTRPGEGAKGWAVPLYRVDDKEGTIHVRQSLDDSDWDTIVGVMQERKIPRLDAHGQMTDAALARIAELDHVLALNLGGSNRLTDDGMQHLARMPQLLEIDLSGWEMPITDRGLAAFRHLTALTRVSLCWPQRITDAGAAHLTYGDRLEHVNLMGTPTGDGTINALTGKRTLLHLNTGKRVTDAGLPLLHRFPAFTARPARSPHYSLMTFGLDANFVLLDGPFTGTGLASLAGLDGLVGLGFFWHTSQLTPASLKALIDLPHLEFLGCQDKLCDDEAMRHIAALPRLRMLMGQGAVASDAGFAALSRSPTIEYFWGRDCPNFSGAGFAALSHMPALRGLGVSCRNVDDRALSTLPRFPALRELMPMDVSDAGFRHVGRCEQLEKLWCMYCRDTTDAATEHIAGLTKLTSYYAGQTKITDRSLEILSRMQSLEKLEFWNCAGITDTGAAYLAALPRLREISFDDCRQITSAVTAVFPPSVHVKVSS